ncbi:unnamed protein product [Symbiodinium natans]|uniref:Reverse transcriptase domain-containing protein n=1 Tax=Symbiodinium natans TaxID=878477 RepID=A0A812J7M1_9DINO|nr:unnamed protein product [Symbiodinium natans]
MRGTTMATEVGGAFVGVGEPTAQGSDEIDYGLVAKCLVPILQVKTDWMKKAGALVTETVEDEPGRHHGDAHPVARLVQRRLGEYCEGDAQNQEDMLVNILGRGTDARLVLKRIDEQQCYARKADMEETAHQHKQWLSKAMEKGMRPLCNALRKEEQVVQRPYMEYDMLERPHIRRDHWAAVWTTGQPLAKSASLMTELEAMDDKAVEAGQGSWPQQMTVSLFAMLPKNLTRERPIALLHILYRQLLLGRGLLRNEVAKTNGVHVVSLFVDLESFFDTIQFQQLITAATALQYPPLILKMALEVYMGARYLVADGVLSAGIRATNGVQAGCPAAPSLAKVALHPVIDKIQRRRDVANVDCWLDDVSIDIQHKSFKQVADSAIRVYRSLKDGMDANGFTISSKKTGFVASSTQASKHLRELLLPHEPQVYDVMRDLGVDSTGGRKRRLVTSATRAKKAGAAAQH